MCKNHFSKQDHSSVDKNLTIQGNSKKEENMKKQMLFFFDVGDTGPCFCSAWFCRNHHAAICAAKPDTGWSTVNCAEPWLKQVEAATNGKVKIQAFHGQTLAKGKDMWDAVKTGITDIGWCFHGYWPGLTPLADVISLPALPLPQRRRRQRDTVADL